MEKAKKFSIINIIGGVLTLFSVFVLYLAVITTNPDEIMYFFSPFTPSGVLSLNFFTHVLLPICVGACALVCGILFLFKELIASYMGRVLGTVGLFPMVFGAINLYFAFLGLPLGLLMGGQVGSPINFTMVFAFFFQVISHALLYVVGMIGFKYRAEFKK